MKTIYLVPVVIIIGFIVLLFFPEPETNFLAYITTALFFVVITIVLLIFSLKKK